MKWQRRIERLEKSLMVKSRWELCPECGGPSREEAFDAVIDEEDPSVSQDEIERSKEYNEMLYAQPVACKNCGAKTCTVLLSEAVDELFDEVDVSADDVR